MSRGSEAFLTEMEEATVESRGRTEEEPAFPESLPTKETQSVEAGRLLVCRIKGEQKADGLPTTATMPRRGPEGLTRRAVGLNMIAGLAGLHGSHRLTGKLGRVATPVNLVPSGLVGGFEKFAAVFPGFERISRQLELGFANDLSGTVEFGLDTVNFQTSCDVFDHWLWNKGSWTINDQQLIFQGTGTYTHTESCASFNNSTQPINAVWTFSNWNASGTTLTINNMPSNFGLGQSVTLTKVASEPVVWSPWDKVNDSYGVIGVGATATGPDQFHIFTVGTDHQVYQCFGDGFHWSGFAPLGGYGISNPAAVSFGPNSIFVFVVGADHALWYLNWDGSHWNGWYKLGGEVYFGIAAGSAGPGRIDVFGVGRDLAMYHLAWNGTAWQPWEYLAGQCASIPGVVSLSPGTINVYVLGTDGAIYQDRFDGTKWLGWFSEFGDGVFGVSACSSAPNRIDLVTAGASDEVMYYKYWNGSAWNGWFKEDGICASAPVIVSGAPNTGDVFVLGLDNHVYHKSFR
jgi:hypothetical protein